MPNYIKIVLHWFQHPPPVKLQDSPHEWNQAVYGQKVQFADDPDDSPKNHVRKLYAYSKKIGTLLYYTMAVYNTIVMLIGSIATHQSKPTSKTPEETMMLPVMQIPIQMQQYAIMPVTWYCTCTSTSPMYHNQRQGAEQVPIFF